MQKLIGKRIVGAIDLHVYKTKRKFGTFPDNRRSPAA